MAQQQGNKKPSPLLPVLTVAGIAYASSGMDFSLPGSDGVSFGGSSPSQQKTTTLVLDDLYTNPQLLYSMSRSDACRISKEATSCASGGNTRICTSNRSQTKQLAGELCDYPHNNPVTLKL